MGKIFVVVAVASLIVGLVGHNNDIVDGLGKALFGVFMILFFIHRFFGTPESTDTVPASSSAHSKHK